MEHHHHHTVLERLAHLEHELRNLMALAQDILAQITLLKTADEALAAKVATLANGSIAPADAQAIHAALQAEIDRNTALAAP